MLFEGVMEEKLFEEDSDKCGCFFHKKVARMKPEADFGKTGLAYGVGGDCLGQKKTLLGG